MMYCRSVWGLCWFVHCCHGNIPISLVAIVSMHDVEVLVVFLTYLFCVLCLELMIADIFCYNSHTYFSAEL